MQESHLVPVIKLQVGVIDKKEEWYAQHAYVGRSSHWEILVPIGAAQVVMEWEWPSTHALIRVFSLNTIRNRIVITSMSRTKPAAMTPYRYSFTNRATA